MKECLDLEGLGIMKSLMIHSEKFGFSPGMKLGVHLTTDEWAVNILKKCFPYFIGQKIYSHAAFSYSAQFDKERFIKIIKKIRSIKNLIYVGNKNIPADIIESIFGKNAMHIKTDPDSTYETVDNIEHELIQHLSTTTGYSVVLFSAGPTANVLQKRIFGASNTFTIDIGSLIDAFCGWDTRAWINDDKEYWMGLQREINS